MTLNDPEVTQTALQLLRNGGPAHWNIALHLAVVLYVYVNECGSTPGGASFPCS